jgi:hypothetical protein
MHDETKAVPKRFATKAAAGGRGSRTSIKQKAPKNPEVITMDLGNSTGRGARFPIW